MSNITHDLLVHGTAAAKAGDTLEAERYFKWLLRLNPTMREMIEAYNWLAELAKDPQVKRNYLDEILARNPGDNRARRKLAILNGEINPEEIIDPDRIISDKFVQPVEGDIERFLCPDCSARMVFNPDGDSLVCENCGTQKNLDGQILKKNPQQGASFTAAMATRVGHTIPVQARIILCRGCGAEFQLTPDRLSGNCPYCDTSYAERDAVEKQIISPDHLIPFRIGIKEVREALKTWIKSGAFSEEPWVAVPRGYYFPIWTFDVGGQINWTCRIRQNDRWETLSDSRVLLHNDIPVLATNHLPDAVGSILNSYDTSKAILYDPRYLSNWPAETYQITIGDASLSARKIALEREKLQITQQYDKPISDLSIDGSSMAVNTYKLILLPIWLTTYVYNKTNYQVAINGQNAIVIGQYPDQGLSDWIGNIFN